MKRLLLVSIICAAAVGIAQQPTQQLSNPANQQPYTYSGLATCVSSGCHGSTEPLNATRVLQNEYYTWLNNDRHAQAYNVLFTDRSARIAKNMRLKKREYEE